MAPSSFTSSSDGPWRGALRESQLAVLLTLGLTALGGWVANASVASARRESIPERGVFERLREARRYTAIVLGSSRAKHGIDPSRFERARCYNFALPGAGARMSRVMGEHFLQLGNHAELLVLEVNPKTFDPVQLWRRVRDDVLSLGLEPALRLEREVYGEPSWSQLAALYVEAIPLWAEAAPPELVLLGVDYRDPIRAGSMPGGRVAADSGFAPLPDQDLEALPEPTLAPVTLDPAEVAALEALLERFQAAGTRVVLVQTPVVSPDEDPFPEFAATIARIAQERGVVHLDWRSGPLAGSFAQDPGAFFDADHLSEAGARAFSEALARELQRRGLLPER